MPPSDAFASLDPSRGRLSANVSWGVGNLGRAVAPREWGLPAKPARLGLAERTE